MRFNRYIEPFLGGGSVFMGLAPSDAVLSDINAELMITYAQVRYRPKQLKAALRSLRVDTETYARFRADSPTSSLETAVRFLYLNRTAFGGMYRLNRDGGFNVPFGPGRSPATLWMTDALEAAARRLKGSTLRVADFADQIQLAVDGDLVYCDPIYSVAHNDNGFVRYNEAAFKWDDQRRLADSARKAAGRGALVLVSNADHAEVSRLYGDAARFVFHRQSRLCPNVAYRRLTSETLFALGPSHMLEEISNRSLPVSLEALQVRRLTARLACGEAERVEPSQWVGHGISRADRR
jgi:DNA adenine methylase